MRQSSKYLLVFFLFVAALAVVGWQLIVYVDNQAMWGKMRQTPRVRPHEQPLPGVDHGAVPIWGGEAFFQNSPPEKIRSPLEETDGKVLNAGRSMYLLYCAQCHGMDHNGRGTVGQSFAPLPTDLRSEKTQGMSDGTWFKVISYGIPGGRQPPLASTVSIPDRWLIIAYLKSLGVRK